MGVHFTGRQNDGTIKIQIVEPEGGSQLLEWLGELVIGGQLAEGLVK